MEAVHQDLLRVGSRRPFDLIQTPNWDSEGLMVACDDDFRTVVSLQTTTRIMQKLNPATWNSKAVDLLAALEKTHLRQAEDIHALSHSVRQHAVDDYGVDPEKVRIHVIPLGLPDRSREHRRERTDNLVRLLFVGRLEPRKGIDLLLAAAPGLLASFPELELRIVGEDLGISLARQVVCRDVPRRCRRRSTSIAAGSWGKSAILALYEEYANADIFCAPSRYESFGLILIEAMMFSLPCIGGRIGGMSEILRDGVDGYLVETGGSSPSWPNGSRAWSPTRRCGGEWAPRPVRDTSRSSSRKPWSSGSSGNTSSSPPDANHDGGVDRCKRTSRSRSSTGSSTSATRSRTSVSRRAKPLRRFARDRRFNLRYRMFTHGTDIDSSHVRVRRSVEELLSDPFFHQSDLLIYNYGIHYVLFDSIFLVPRHQAGTGHLPRHHAPVAGERLRHFAIASSDLTT